MNPAHALGVLWALSAAVMCLGWLWQRRRHNAGIADVLWATLLVIGAWLLAALGAGALSARLSLAVLGGLWGMRLALHLAGRVRGEPEDGRYQALRARWRGAQGRWFAFFQIQAVSIPLFALPFLAVAANAHLRPPWLAAGALIGLLGVLGESLADRQLARFRAAPAHRGRTCRAGVWRYSRHPNYFFEWLHWFTYVLLAWEGGLFLLSMIGPLLMLASLLWVTGIPFVEAQALRSRPEDYRDYQRDTSMFIPWFPKRASLSRERNR